MTNLPCEVVTTNHAKQRTKDRLGLSKKLADKKAAEAMEFGVSHADTTGSLHRFFTALYFKNQAANNIRIYHRKVYIFAGKVCITILPLPNKYSAIADKIQKRLSEAN